MFQISEDSPWLEPVEGYDLSTYLEELLTYADQSLAPLTTAPLQSLIVPHAGLRFSGIAAAAGYATARNYDYETIVVLCANHYAESGQYYTTEKEFKVGKQKTPLAHCGLKHAAQRPPD